MIRVQEMNEINQKLLRGVQMLNGAVFSKRAPLAAGGKKGGAANYIMKN
jgi:hypothetical protein